MRYQVEYYDTNTGYLICHTGVSSQEELNRHMRFKHESVMVKVKGKGLREADKAKYLAQCKARG